MKDNKAYEDLRNEDHGVLVTVGFLPGLTVDLIPLRKARVILYSNTTLTILQICALLREI